MEPESRPRLIRFGEFVVDLRSRELFKDGRRIKVQDQPLRLLALLLEKPGELVTRAELHERLWPEDTFVDFDHSLNVDIQRLRQALGDSAQDPRFIETLPRKGYRFICPLETAGEETAWRGLSWPPRLRVLRGKGQQITLQSGRSESGVALSDDDATPKPGNVSHFKPASIPGQEAEDDASGSRRGLRLLASAVAAVLLIAAGVSYWKARSGSVDQESVLAPLPFTTYTGRESFPSFSPDGNQVAFCWNGEKQNNWDIYIKQVGSTLPRRLTDDPGRDICPVWSPDGRSIAFLRSRDGQRATLLQVPATGSPEQVLAEVSLPGDDLYIRPGPYLAWLPGSRKMVIVDRSTPEGPSSLYLFSTNTREKVRLTQPPVGAGDDDAPAVSPDGRWLAFSRGREVSHLFLVALSGDQRPKDQPKQITFENQHTNSPTWTAGGRQILFSMGMYQQHSLWQMSFSGGRPGQPKRLLAFAGEGAWYPSASRQGNQLAFMRWVGGGSEIWRAGTPIAGRKAHQPGRLIFSTRDDEEPEYSPDGRKIVFKSNRSGRFEIWVCNSDGSDPVQLTFAVGSNTFLPRWSPDGRRILFTSNPEGHNDLFVIDAQGGAPLRLTSEPSNEVAATFSRNGRWIYFHSDRTGKNQIWKMPSHPDGDEGKSAQVTRDGGISPEESLDGRFLYYLKEGNPRSLWRVPADGGEEVRMLPSVLHDNFTVTEDGIIFIESPRENRYLLKSLELLTGKITTLCEPSNPGWGLTVSPASGLAARSILYVNCRTDDSDLMLVEDFR